MRFVDPVIHALPPGLLPPFGCCGYSWFEDGCTPICLSSCFHMGILFSFFGGSWWRVSLHTVFYSSCTICLDISSAQGSNCYTSLPTFVLFCFSFSFSFAPSCAGVVTWCLMVSHSFVKSRASAENLDSTSHGRALQPTGCLPRTFGLVSY